MITPKNRRNALSTVWMSGEKYFYERFFSVHKKSRKPAIDTMVKNRERTKNSILENEFVGFYQLKLAGKH